MPIIHDEYVCEKYETCSEKNHCCAAKPHINYYGFCSTKRKCALIGEEVGCVIAAAGEKP